MKCNDGLLLMTLLLAGLSFLSCTLNHTTGSAISAGWTRVDAGGFFTFCLPEGVQLVSDEKCEECAWGSTYSDDHIRLYAEYTSWNGEFSPQYLAKQVDFVREMTEIDGEAAKIQGWSLSEPVGAYKFTIEARIYDPQDGRLIARMSALCKDAGDMETVSRIFKTIRFLKSNNQPVELMVP